jgi:hypothetical protein
MRVLVAGRLSLWAAPAVAPPPLMGAHLIVLDKPEIEIGLQLGDRPVEPPAERHAVELVEQGLVEALANAVVCGLLAFVRVWSMFSMAR